MLMSVQFNNHSKENLLWSAFLKKKRFYSDMMHWHHILYDTLALYDALASYDASIYLRNFDSVSKNHSLGMYVYVMEAYTI